MDVSTSMQCDDEIRYDAFLAHSSKDAAIVETVLQILEDRGIKCCYSRRDFLPGCNLINFIKDAVCKSSMTIAFISKDFLESPYCELERNLALQKALEGRHHVLIPILLDVQKDDLPLTVSSLICLCFNRNDFQTKLLKALGVQDPDTRPTYQDLKKENEDLKKAFTMIQQSPEHGCQLMEKDGMIRLLQAENAALKESKLEDVKNIALELDECRHQMSVMEENLQQKEDTILQLHMENQKLRCANTDVSSTHKQPTVLDTCTELRNLVENEMNDMKAEEVMAFFTKVLLMLQTMIKCCPGDNTVIKKMYAAVLLWIGWSCEDEECYSSLNYHTQALETVHDLYGANTSHSDTALILNNIAVCQCHLRSYQTAVEYHSQALQMEEQLARPSGMSKDLARSYHNLGVVQVGMGGCTQQGIDNLTQALAMYRKLDGDRDEDIQDCLGALADAYDQSGEKAKALACRKERHLQQNYEI